MADFKSHYNRNLSYNVHNLLHLVDCISQFRRVDTFSAYKFENAIRKLQFLIKSNYRVLSQVNNRLAERTGVGYSSKPSFWTRKISHGQCYRLEGVNNCFLIITEVLDCKSRCKVRRYHSLSTFFADPLPSSLFGIYRVSEDDLGEVEVLDIFKLGQAVYKLPYKLGYVFPLIV